jgi:hypothetical protein
MDMDIFTLWSSLPNVNHKGYRAYKCRSDETPLLSALRPVQSRLSCLALLIFEVARRVPGPTAA